MYSRFALYAAALLLLAACQSTTTAPQAADTPEMPEGFQTIDFSRLDKASVAQDANLYDYSALLLPPLDVDSVEIKQLSSTRIPSNKDWELTEDDKGLLQETFQELMLEQLADSKHFVVADQAGKDTLKVQVILNTIAPNAPKDDFDSRPSARSRVYSEGFGDVSIRLEVSDSSTGKMLLIATDKRRGDQTWRVNNRVTNWSEVRRMLRAWSVQIRSGLDDLAQPNKN